MSIRERAATRRPGAYVTRGGAGMGDFWDVVTFKPVRDVVDDAANAIAEFGPLRDLATGPMRDFAQSAPGHAVLVAISTVVYGTTGGGLVPFLGPQLASIAFAIPGMLSGDEFGIAWMTGVKERAEGAAMALGGDIANLFAQQLGDTLEKMVDDYGVDNLVTDSLKDLIDRYGIRQDVAAFAKSLWNKLEIPNHDAFEWTSGDEKSGILRLQGAGISPATLASSAVVGTWAGDNSRVSLSTLARTANYGGFSEYRSAPAPAASSYRSANTSPNRSSGDMLLGVTIVAALGALAWTYWPKHR